MIKRTGIREGFKDKKKVVFLTSLIIVSMFLVFSLFFTSALIIDYFNNTEQSEILTFGNVFENNSRYLEVPLNANVTSASVNLTGNTTISMINESVIGGTSGSAKGGGFIGGDFYYVTSGSIKVSNRTNTSIGSYTLPLNCGNGAYGSTTNGTDVIYSICQVVIDASPINTTIVWASPTGDYLKSYNYSFPNYDKDMDYFDGELYVYISDGTVYVINGSTGVVSRNMTIASGGSGFEIVDGFIYLGIYPKKIYKYNGTTLISTFSVLRESTDGIAYNDDTNEFWTVGTTITFTFCFPDYTSISILDGEKYISEIEIGDNVLSYVDNKVFEDEVIGVKKRNISNYKNKLYEICTNRGCVNATYNHLFWTNQGYQPAEDLRKDYILKNINLEEEVVTSYKVFNVSNIYVWDIDMKIGNTFFAEGFLVDENGKNSNVYPSISIIEVGI